MTRNDELGDRDMTKLHEEYDELMRKVIDSGEFDDPDFRHPRLAEVAQRIGDLLIEHGEFFHRRATRWRDGA